MFSKILNLVLLLLLIIVSVTLYKTDSKYSVLKKEIKKKETLINDQLTYINKNNTSHEFDIKKKLKKLEFPKTNSLDIELYKNKETLKLELLDTNEFQSSKYFDILINEWSTNNFESAIYEAKELCKSN